MDPCERSGSPRRSPGRSPACFAAERSRSTESGREGCASTPASAAPPEPVVYDALGDSYGSGFGVPPYESYGRSSAAYAVQIDGRMRIDLDDFIACAGARTSDLVSSQLGALDEDTDLVTVSIGGNDINWGRVVGACVALDNDPLCAVLIAQTRQTIQTELPGMLDESYREIAEAAPNAHVVVIGYPRLFSPKFGAYFEASPAEQQAMNDGADLLNAVIAAKAAEYGFQFVDVTKRFDGHGVNAPRPWIIGLEDPVNLFHPNLSGYRAYAAAVTSSVNPRDLR